MRGRRTSGRELERNCEGGDNVRKAGDEWRARRGLGRAEAVIERLETNGELERDRMRMRGGNGNEEDEWRARGGHGGTGAVIRRMKTSRER